MAELTFGQRLQAARTRTGKSRPVIAGLVGKSPEWVKAVERGTIAMPRLPMLLRLAEALGIDDLATLTGSTSVPVEAITKGAHRAAGDMAAALTAAHITTVTPQDLAAITTRTDTAWKLWHTSGEGRDVLADTLPVLLVDAHASARAAAGTTRRRILAELARAYHLAQLYWAYQPAAEQVYLAADRAANAAYDADDPAAIAVALWYQAHVLRNAGRAGEIPDLAHEALRLLPNDGTPNTMAAAGLMHLATALAHAKLGQSGEAWRAHDQAAIIAAQLGSWHHPWLMFGAPAVAAYGVTIHLETAQPGKAVDAANHIDPEAIPSRTRQAAFLLDIARGYRMRGDDFAAIHLAGKAANTSPDTTRFSTFCRAMLTELSARPGLIRKDAAALMHRLDG